MLGKKEIRQEKSHLISVSAILDIVPNCCIRNCQLSNEIYIRNFGFSKVCIFRFFTILCGFFRLVLQNEDFLLKNAHRKRAWHNLVIKKGNIAYFFEHLSSQNIHLLHFWQHNWYNLLNCQCYLYYSPENSKLDEKWRKYLFKIFTIFTWSR